MSAPIFVKHSAIARSHLVDEKMGWPLGTALGRLCSMWSERITLKMPQALPQAMLQVMRKHFFVTETDAQRLIDAMCCDHAKFLVQNDDGTYDINGLANEIVKTQGRKSRAEHGAAARWAPKPAAKKPRSKKSAHEMPQAMLDECSKQSPKQCLNLNHSANNISDAPLAVSTVLVLGEVAGLNPGDKPDFAVRDKADNARVWDAYSAAYTQRYGAPPKSSSMGYGLCKRLVQRLGVQPAIEVARFFLTVNKRWYIENLHPLSSAVKDAEALHTQMVTGRTMTSTQADQKDRTQSNLEAARGAVELLARGKGNPFDVSNQ